MSGILLNNRYRILRQLSSGGFGKTFVAEDTGSPSKQPRVIKKLHPASEGLQEIIIPKFKREAAVLERLSETIDQLPKVL